MTFSKYVFWLTITLLHCLPLIALLPRFFFYVFHVDDFWWVWPPSSLLFCGSVIVRDEHFSDNSLLCPHNMYKDTHWGKMNQHEREVRTCLWDKKEDSGYHRESSYAGHLCRSKGRNISSYCSCSLQPLYSHQKGHLFPSAILFFPYL